MSGTHALLSASSAVRWLNCPPSARLTQDMPDQTSEYAAEGTLAALEKTLGKQTFDALLGQYVVMPPGKPTLARDTDRRPALIDRPSAAEDFAAQ